MQDESECTDEWSEIEPSRRTEKQQNRSFLVLNILLVNLGIGSAEWYIEDKESIGVVILNIQVEEGEEWKTWRLYVSVEEAVESLKGKIKEAIQKIQNGTIKTNEKSLRRIVLAAQEIRKSKFLNYECGEILNLALPE